MTTCMRPSDMRRHDNNPRGFTIVELMVVVSLIALLIGFSVPLVFKIDELSRDRSGVNTFGVAVTATRAWATRRIADDDSSPNASYSGAAVIVSPWGELYIAENDQESGLEPRNGYKRLRDADPIDLPAGMGAVGIVGPNAIVAPPFAIRFDERGRLIPGSEPGKPNMVIYDFGSGYNSSPRGGGYDPHKYDPEHGDFNPSILDQQTGRPRYSDFGELESVVGVIVYSKADFEDAGGNFRTNTAPEFGCPNDNCGSGVAGIRTWMLHNGTALFFSRNTGQVIRVNAP